MIYYNPLDSFYKSKIGAVREGESVNFKIFSPFKSCNLIFINDKTKEVSTFKMQKNGEYFSQEIIMPVGLYGYYFDFNCGKYLVPGYNLLGKLDDKISYYQLSVFSKDYVVPEWTTGGIIYQIFPDRFYRENIINVEDNNRVIHKNWGEDPVYLPSASGEITNNDFFGGNLKGITQKLSYISSLGVTILYLNPIFKAYSNHRYDTGNYMEIDNLLGSEDDLIELIEKAKDYNIKIVLDGVFNHCGSDSIYFNANSNYNSVGAYNSFNSQYKDWFNFIDYPNSYQSWWGIKTLPSFNKNSQSLIDFIAGDNGVLEKYTKLGIGGWRLDVVDELPSFLVKKIRNVIKKTNKDAFIIGEVWEDASNKISYGERCEYFLGKELDSVMNYPLKDSIISSILCCDFSSLVEVIVTQLDHYPFDALCSLMNILSTHDTARILSVFSGIDISGKSKEEIANTFLDKNQFDIAFFRLKIATLLQFTLYGIPSVYYGDEVGLQGFFDPVNRRCFPWEKENNEILSWIKKISKIRKSYSAFEKGSLAIEYQKGGCIIYKRADKDSEILICINISSKDVKLSFEGDLFEILEQKDVQNEYNLRAGTMAVIVNKIKF